MKKILLVPFCILAISCETQQPTEEAQDYYKTGTILKKEYFGFGTLYQIKIGQDTLYVCEGANSNSPITMLKK